MMKRLKRFLRYQRNLMKFQVERFIVRGPFHRLFVIIVGIALISISTGGITFALVGGFPSIGDAIWWAFLRLTDPGYLGDDNGLARRIVSTILTVLGYVVFLGALVAIMTQWLNQTLNQLQSGFTPIAQRGHIVILGWTSQTPMLVQELVGSEARVKRFLSRRGERQRLRIAILAETVNPAMVQELKERLGARWDHRQIILRSGTPLRVEHLRRVDAFHAAAIIIPADDFSAQDADITDARAIKALLAIEHSSRGASIEEKPRIVAELFDAHKAPIARQAYTGQLEILSSDVMISRLLVQTIRHPGLSYVYSELLTHTDGNEIYVSECDGCEGLSWGELQAQFTRVIPIGVSYATHGVYRTALNPDSDTLIGPDAHVIFLAPDYEATKPENQGPVKTKTDYRLRLREIVLRLHDPTVHRRVLILGWNRSTPALIQAFDWMCGEQFEVDILSSESEAERIRATERYGVHIERLSLRHLEGDYTSATDLSAVHPETYDHVLLLAVDWTVSEAESDARTILGFLVLQETLAHKTKRPLTLVELMDPANETLIERLPHEVLVTPVILSRLLTHMTIRRELRSVFETLLGAVGPGIVFRPADEFGLVNHTIGFEDLQRKLAESGELPLGLYVQTHKDSKAQIVLNPDRDRRWTLQSGDAIITLTKG